MKSAFVAFCILVSVPTLTAVKWDTLRVTFGQDPTKFFTSQPRTDTEAAEAGFTRITKKCGESSAYNGIAYVKDNDYGVTLLYDINGYIAGIQVGITEDQALKADYPSKNIPPPFVLEAEGTKRYVLTAYFTDPSKICTEGRTKAQFETEGTGTDLYLQTGSTPADVTLISKSESDITAPWVKGKCFFMMGTHYWYNISEDMDCNNFFPVFLLYNGGQLDAFGWALEGDFPSKRFEHPPAQFFNFFMQKVPKCLMAKSVSTMHIYLTTPGGNTCS